MFGCLESEIKKREKIEKREKRENESRKQGPVMENGFDES